MSDLPPPERTSHPFWMYEMIKEIPLSFRATLEQTKDLRLARGTRMVSTGNGTAFFSAWMGSQVLSEFDVPLEIVQSFELEHYRRAAAREVVVGVSHSGITKSTVDSLRRAKRGGGFTVGVTHFANRPIAEVCDLTKVIGNGPDRSRCHTKTYVDSAAAVAKIGFAFARLLGQDTRESERRLNEMEGRIAHVVSESESRAKEVVDGLSEIKQVVFVGAGPNLVTAREAALKIKESCFVPSEGIELEEEAHGSWVALDGSSLLVVIAPDGSSTARAQDLIRAAAKVGARTVAVSDSDLGPDYSFEIPRVPEILSPFLTIIPLYYISYFLSVRLGNNPDYLRYLTPAYWDARKTIFPPGTH